MSNQNTVRSDEIALKKSIHEITEKTYQLYSHNVIKCSPDEFKMRFIWSEHSEAEIDTLTSMKLGDEKATLIQLTAITALIVQLLDLGYAHAFSQERNYAEAWRYISKAEFWNGCMFAICGTATNLDDAIKSEKSAVAQTGGKAKSEIEYGPLMNKVAELFTAPREHKWQSLSDAARRIYSDIETNSKDLATLSKMQYVKTISNWIKTIPEYESYITQKKKAVK